jgi:hypothetical protein
VQIPQPDSLLHHFLWVVLPIILPLGIQQWWMHSANAKAIRDRDQRLSYVLMEHPLHSHGEKGDAVPLTTEGLRYPKVVVNGK